MKKSLLLIAMVLLSSCAILFPSPKKDDKEYVMKHGRLVVVEKPKTPAKVAQPGNTSSNVQAKVAQTTASKSSQRNAIPTHYQQIVFPSFQYVAPHPTQYRVVISDSITGYFLPDRSLPIVKLSFYFRESTLPSKPEEAAAVALTSPMYRRGGSLKVPPALLDDSLELLAASIGGDLGAFHSSLNLNCLSGDFNKTLALLEDVYRNPGFDSSRLALQKNVYTQNLLHKYDRPQELLNGLSRWAMYQSGPRMWNAKPKEVEKVKREDLLRFAQGKFASNRVVFAVSGDFDPDTMKQALQSFFGRWQKANASPASPSISPFRNKPGFYLADKDITQANISMAQPFIKRPHVDYYPAAVASYILGGGGFTSRLTARVRSDEGLAYSVQSYVESDYDEPGTAGVALQTKVESAAFAIKLVNEEIQKLAEKGPTQEELESAKLSLIESLPGLFDSPHATADVFARSEVWGRSFDHFKNYPAEIRAVTADDVMRCIRQYFAPAKMTVTIVGPAAKLQKDFGTIQVVPQDSLEMR